MARCRRIVVVLSVLVIVAGLLPGTDRGSHAAAVRSTAPAEGCGAPDPAVARCFSFVRQDPLGRTGVAAIGSFYGPPDLQAAYNLPSTTAGLTQTVAVVAAYDDPSAEADLQVYRAQFGLPSCTTANGCFRKVNQNGGATYPP